MSQDSSDGDALADWALVSQEGSIEGDETSSGSGSSDEFVNVTCDGVVYGRHRSSSPEAGPVSESLASSEMSALLQSSLDEVDQDEATENAQHSPESELDTGEHPPPSVPITEASPSIAGSMASTGDESTDIITEDEHDEVQDQHLDSSLDVLLPPGINIASCLSSLSLVPGLPVSTDTGADNGADVSDDGAEVTDDGVVSLSTDSLGCSRSESEEVGSHSNCDGLVKTEDPGDQPDDVRDANEDAELESVQVHDDVAAAAASDLPVLIDIRVDELKREDVAEGGVDADGGINADGGVDADRGDDAGSVEGACGEGRQWLKYPIENSGDQCHTIRLGDGRVIVAPPGADLESLAASLHLANKSETSSDAGSDSDFVRLEAISSCSSSNENTDTEGEEHVSREELPAPVVEDEAAAAAAPVEDVMAESVSSVSSRFRFLPPQNADANEEPQLPPNVQDPPPAADENNDGDTESMSGHSEDDRIESDQSEANAEQIAEEEEEPVLNDIGDIPLVAGHRQYVHKCNKHLNWTLDVVVIMVILMTIGIGIGHSIGSMREQAIQNEMKTAQLSQLSLLHKRVLQLVEDKGALKRAETESRQEIGDLSSTNSELRGQLDAMGDELTIKVTALSQCKKTANNLQQMRELLKNEISKLQQENTELSSHIADLQSQTMAEDDAKTEEVEKLKKQANLLKIENADLKAEVARLRFLLPHSSSESFSVDVEDEGYRSMEDVSTSCSKPVESHGRMTDLKSRINLLELENADMRAEIGRLRYKSHPGNVQGWKHGDDDLEDREIKESQDLDDETDEENSAEEILKLKSELDATKKQAENWERLYVTLKEQGSHTKCNISMDFFSCMKLFTMQINNSINATAIKDFLNVSKLLLSVEDVKDAFVNEFQNIWKEFSGSGRREEKQEKTKEEKEKPPTAQKKWSDSVKDILNRTQSSMSDMSQQIKDTWNQVKNLSEELWKKHEPSLSKVAGKITERVKTFSDNIHKKIHQKASKWFRKHQKQRKGGKDEGKHASWKKDGKNKKWKHNSEKVHKTWKQRRQEYKNQKKSEKKHHKEKMEDHHKKKYERSSKQYQKEEEKLKKKVNKSFQHLRKLMEEMSEAKHLTMTESDVQEVCDFFTGFQAQWDMYRWLKYTDVQWTICQSSWWHSRLNDQIPLLGLKCLGKTYGWQLEWAPSADRKGNFRKKRGKGYQLGKKLRKKILERNHAAGKPYSYENEKLMQNDDDSTNRTEWYEQRAKDREEYRKGGGEKHVDRDWYEELMKNRFEQRADEHKSDWLFERAADRKEGRGKEMNIPTHNLDSHMDSDGQVDPHSAWVFARAEDREYHNTKPDSWYFERAEAREESHGGDYETFGGVDEYVEGDYDDFNCPGCEL